MWKEGRIVLHAHRRRTSMTSLYPMRPPIPASRGDSRRIRFREQTGSLLLTVRLTGFDPLRPSAVQIFCVAKILRGRDASYLAPPAQVRTCGFPAYGSHL